MREPGGSATRRKLAASVRAVPLTPELHELAQRVSNWGRWGADDQRGTLNLITPDVVRAGAAAVRRGPGVLARDPVRPDRAAVGQRATCPTG